MLEASFYLLPSESAQEKYLFTCKLIEKIYRAGRFCYVATETSEQSQLMDDLLWTFRPGSFMPHQIYSGEPPAFTGTVLIGTLTAPENWQNTIINLSSRCPQDFRQVHRLVEILDNSEASKEAGRLRYRQYQQAGFAITTHKME